MLLVLDSHNSLLSQQHKAAAIKTPAGAKSSFGKTPAPQKASDKVSTKSKKRGPFHNKRKVAPVDVETVRERSNAKGDMDPFQELTQDADLERLVILEMAKQRQTAGANSNSTPSSVNGGGEERTPVDPIISEGFYWKDYPACEQVLYNHMEEYYEISAIKKDYKVQQEFNNVLVEQVRQAATDTGCSVDMDDKKLRDRIRCFFKTHLQNAKKRLATLQKHADAPENRALVAVFVRMVRRPELTYEASLALGGGGEDAAMSQHKKRRLHRASSVASPSASTV